MEIDTVQVVDIVPYEANPRKNDNAVDVVAKSIKEFGFLVPVILDDTNTLVAGHTRIKAAIKLGIKEVPAIYASNLNKEQLRAFRIMDNKSSDYSTWDYNILKQEILELKEVIDIDLTGFKEDEISFFNSETDGPANNSYEEWRKSGSLQYGNEDKTGHQTILLHFKTPQDVVDFSALVNQTITNRTKYIWFPKQETESVKDLQYEE